jgi:collagen beta-1,O-galactosyltransferase
MPTNGEPLRVYVINLPRSHDRRAQMEERLSAAGFHASSVTFVPAVDGRELDTDKLHAAGVRLFSNWKQTGTNNPYYTRDLKWGEVGCALSHHSVWKRVAEGSPAIVLEDDVLFAPNACARIEEELGVLSAHAPEWDLCYIGRRRMGPPFTDAPGPEPRACGGLVVPTFSYCTHAYALSPRGARKLLASGLEKALVPVDELLPALYTTHPRDDVRAQFAHADRLRAYAIVPDLARQADAPSEVELSLPISPTHDRTPSARTRARAVVRLLQGDSLESLSQELDVDVPTLMAWRSAFVAAGEGALRAGAPPEAERPRAPHGLATLLDGDPADFLERMWPHAWSVFRGRCSRLELPAGLFDVRRMVRSPQVRMSVFGKNGFRAGIASTDDALNFYEHGDTLYLVGLERAFPAVRELCDGIARDLRLDPAYVHVEGFASRAGSGSSMHYDFDVNFNVQLVGSKEWRVAANPVVENPLQSFVVRRGVTPMSPYDGAPLPSEMPADAASYRLDPGDVIFLPRGVWHETRVLTDSVAIALVIKPPAYLSLLLGELQNRLRMDARWRGYPLEKDRARVLGELIRALPPILAQMQPEELLFNVARVRWAKDAKPSLERLAEPRHGEQWSLVVDGLDLEFPVGERLVPLVEWVTKQQDVFTTEGAVVECFGTSPMLARKLISYLVDVGALVRVTET